jgi:hypothetical protein
MDAYDAYDEGVQQERAAEQARELYEERLSPPALPAGTWTEDEWRRAVHLLQERLDQCETERKAWKRWTYEAEARVGGGDPRGLTADDLGQILIAKGECYAIASGTDDPREMLSYQEMAKVAFERLQKLTERLSRPAEPVRE